MGLTDAIIIRPRPVRMRKPSKGRLVTAMPTVRNTAASVTLMNENLWCGEVRGERGVSVG